MAGVQLKGLLQINMPVKDIERAITFYRDTLGLPFQFRAGNLAFFDLDGVRLLVDVPEGEGNGEFDHPGSVLYFRVEDIQGAYTGLKGRGVEFIGEPHLVHNDGKVELWMAFFRDGDQNVHAIASEVPVRG